MASDIQILLHESDPYPKGYHHFIWGLYSAWRESGLDVAIARGVSALKPARLVIPHINLTLTPPAVRRALDELPNVVNRGLYDISKRRISHYLLGPDDSYDGPVMVKTDRNFGGVPEETLRNRRRSLLGRAVRKIRKLGGAGGFRWDRATVLDIRAYPIFDSIREVPEGVFENENLVVERFFPEKEGEMFFTRSYFFLGDRYRSVRVGSLSPIVKGGGDNPRESGQPVPPEVLAVRENLRMDYGKIDYVIHEGQPIIFDVNRTPGAGPPDGFLRRTKPFAPGVLPLLQRPPGEYTVLESVDVDLAAKDSSRETP